MCELRRFTIAAALALLPFAAEAQTLPTEAELVERMERLTPLYLAAEAEADLADDARYLAREAAARQDTVQVGPFSVVTSADQAERARRIWSEEWAAFEPMTRGRAQPLENVTFVFHEGRPREYVTRGFVRSVTFTAARPVSEADVRAAVRREIAAAVVTLLPGGFQDILWGRSAASVGTAAEVHRALGTAPAALARACYADVVVACWTALGQMDPAADVVSTWLTPEEQRAITWRVTLPGPARTATRNRCLEGDAAACRQGAVQRLSENHPLPADVRASLFWFALERGGAGALDRLWSSVDASRLVFDAGSVTPEYIPARTLGPRNDIRSHLEAASGVDGDRLVREWLAEIHAARPETPVTQRRARTSTLLWITLLAALAARSTRWRLG